MLSAVSVFGLSVSDLRVQTMRNPSGIDVLQPQFSWLLNTDERGVVQTSYQLVITSEADGSGVVFDSGKKESAQSVAVDLNGVSLQPATRYYWHVTVSDNKGHEATSTETAFFETGLMGTGWSNAQWIKASNRKAGENEMTDYVVEGKVQIERIAAGLCFAKLDANNFYYWQLNTENSNPRLRPHMWSNGNPTCLAEVDLTGKVTLNNTDEFALRIEVTGASRARTYINNILVDDRTGNFKFGAVGMREDHASNNTIEVGVYDDITVKTADGALLFSEDFSGENHFTGGTIQNGRLRVVGSTSGHVLVWQITDDGMPMFRKTFQTDKEVVSAWLFTSGLGVYDLFMNGKRVGHEQPDGTTLYEELKPGWTDYRKRVFYSTHNVTSLMTEGRNAIGAIVTPGWWAGAVMHGAYGSPTTGLKVKLVVNYADSSQDIIVSDNSWLSSKKGALKMGDIYDGEIYDARLATTWTTADYDDSDWNGVEENREFSGQIDAFTGGYVMTLPDHVKQVQTATIHEGVTATGTDFGMAKVVAQQEGIGTIELKKGQSVVIDFGQNIVGWVDFRVKGQAGNRLQMRFVEMLNDTGARSRGNDGPGGTPYLANLRSAKASLYYTLRGDADGESYHPSTTFFGFRYCEITPSDDVVIESIVAQPISSSTTELGSVETSNALVNQLFSNITWGQRGNLLSIPTDCPQRDERLGWTADTQVFCRTGLFNAAMESFYRKWMQDMRDGQNNEGAYPGVAPECWGTPFGQTVWADAGIVVPYSLYVMTGNKDAISENYASMERYMNYLATQSFDGYKYNGGGLTWGDWLSFVNTDTRYIAVAYYAYTAQLMAKMSRALSETENDAYAQKAQHYDKLFQNIKKEFRERYITPSIRQNTQTAYLMALAFNLLEGDEEIEQFKMLLWRNIRTNGYKLNTGFAGTALLNTTLSRFGLDDYAYNLLLQRYCPSWLYSVDQGATTIWERWNSYTKESGFGDPAMNSFNHYAYGAVGEWMYRYMLGIEYDEQQPGFKHIILQPKPDLRATWPRGQEHITWARGSHKSYYGEIRSAWQASGDLSTLDYECTVPTNATATLYLPVASADTEVYEGGVVAAKAEGVEYVGYENGCQVYRLGSGSYKFSSTLIDAAVPTRYVESASGCYPVYDLSGHCLQTSDALSGGLRPGIYISNSKKFVVN